MTAKPKPTRGGARNTGHMMPSNTSGMDGIGFKPTGNTVQATSCAGELRFSRSISLYGARNALAHVIAKREEEGYPVPTVEYAVKMFNKWKREQKRRADAASELAMHLKGKQ